MKYIFLFFLFFLFFLRNSFSLDEDFIDPFFQKLETKEVEKKEIKKEMAQRPFIKLEGILWENKEKAFVLIEGKVYKKGDFLMGNDGKIYTIDKDSIVILYNGNLFAYKIEEEGKNED